MTAVGGGIVESSSAPLLLERTSRCSSSLASVDELRRREEMKYVLKTGRRSESDDGEDTATFDDGNEYFM